MCKVFGTVVVNSSENLQWTVWGNAGTETPHYNGRWVIAVKNRSNKRTAHQINGMNHGACHTRMLLRHSPECAYYFASRVETEQIISVENRDSHLPHLQCMVRS